MPLRPLAAALSCALLAAACSKRAPATDEPSVVVAPAASTPPGKPGLRRVSTSSGLSVEVPEGYRAVLRPAPGSEGVEVLLVFPESESPDELWNDPKRLSRGAIVIEVMALSPAEKSDKGFAARVMREAAAAFPGTGPARALEGFPFPAYRLDPKAPRHLRLYLFTPDELVKLRAEAWGPAFESVSSSLRGPR